MSEDKTRKPLAAPVFCDREQLEAALEAGHPTFEGKAAAMQWGRKALEPGEYELIRPLGTIVITEETRVERKVVVDD